MELDVYTLLHARYVIDGVAQETTPAQMLSEVALDPAPTLPAASERAIVDESPDPGLSRSRPNPKHVDRYLEAVANAPVHAVAAPFAARFTRCRMAGALCDALWRLGHFALGDLCLDLDWQWNDASVGNMAAFYASVQAAAEYADALGIRVRDTRFRFSNEPGPCLFSCSAALRPVPTEDELFSDQPFRAESPRMAAASLPAQLVGDEKSWIVYIPFDTSDYRLGGSLLAQQMHLEGDVAPALSDGDYLIDCYEVVRELVEDGIVLSAASVSEGGLLAALHRMCPPQTGARVDLSDLARATGGTDPVRLLFSEVPGVLIQIRDIDFDYLDAELLLQDVVFYPLGHPVPGDGSVQLHSSAKTGIEHILEALVRNQGGEGED